MEHPGRFLDNIILKGQKMWDVLRTEKKDLKFNELILFR